MKIYFASVLQDYTQEKTLTKINAMQRLLSFWYTEKTPKEKLQNYIEIGETK